MYIERFVFGGIRLELRGEDAWLPSKSCVPFREMGCQESQGGGLEEADHIISLSYQGSLPEIPACALQKNNLYSWRDQKGRHILKKYGERQFSYGVRQGRQTQLVFPDSYRSAMYSQAILEAANLFEILMDYGLIVLHASYVLVNGRGLLFSGPSGIGKSTQAALWRQYAGAEIINGDRCLVDTTHLTANGIFYAGTSGICRNLSAPIAAIVLLGQKADNILCPASGKEAFAALLNQCSYYSWDGESAVRAMGLVANLAQGVKVYRLDCRPGEAAVRLLQGKVF